MIFSPRTFLALLLCLTLQSCGSDREEAIYLPENPAGVTISAESTAPEKGCRRCHSLALDNSHDFACSTCHAGEDRAAEKDLAHSGLIAKPAAPDRAADKCAICHSQVKNILLSPHFTSRNMVNLVRHHFGADRDLASASDIPIRNNPENLLELADDLLRRNCLSCHLSYEGDQYSAISRGTGCAACHLEYREGKLFSHRFFRKPSDQACLACHYGNRVGNDYYGRFEHDFKHEYRTPYQIDGSYPPRPFGLEQHQLVPDIHQKAGIACIDCHPGGQLMGESPGISCEGCHLWQQGDKLPGQNLEAADKDLILTTSHEQRRLSVPLVNDTLHREYRQTADCQVCHAQWSYADRSTHLLRLDVDNYADWDDLVVQSSSEVEILLSNSLYGNESYTPSMTDKLDGQQKNGIWLKGYDIRRWESPLVSADGSGKLHVVRPILDLLLNWVNSDGEVVFNSAKGTGSVFLPYTPHTTGPAGAFYRQRLTEMTTNINSEKDPSK